MILVLSGEGPTDIGQMDAGVFQPGPMARLADEIIQRAQGFEYSYIGNGAVAYVHKSELKGDRPKALLVGKKRGANTPENKWFLRNAAMLARKAKELSRENADTTVAILFRDADRGSEYQAKRKSIQDGFSLESYPTGVAMVPLPTSEAWLLSSVLDSAASLDGHRLENFTDRDLLKQRLADIAGGTSVRDMNPSPDSISLMLDSYSRFRSDLELCIKTLSWSQGPDACPAEE